ncbi:MAG: hemin-degrading factor [Burkholderiales bacterium]|nr:hemin-degrading factor [Burkholderiales bacterium]
MNAPVNLRADPQLLNEAFRAIKAEKNLRNRDAAAALGVTEGEVIASGVGSNQGFGAIRLKGDYAAMIARLETLGDVMALTRNESVVHERVGTYRNASHEGHVGLVVGEDIDLRIFYSHWKHGFAVTEDTPRGPQRSLQIYDAAGAAVHKVFLKPQSSLEEYTRLVDDWTAAEQSAGISVIPAAVKTTPRPDAEIDVDGLQLAWAGMKDTHEFFGLLKKFSVARTQALRLVGDDFAYRVGHGATLAMLESAAAAALPIMCFVGNPGIIQIHTGPVVNIKVMGDWVNVLDPAFNLHLRADRIAQSWVVQKPTTEGTVTSLELFDGEGETIAMFFGKRKPGVPELPAWRDLVAALPRL